MKQFYKAGVVFLMLSGNCMAKLSWWGDRSRIMHTTMSMVCHTLPSLTNQTLDNLLSIGIVELEETEKGKRNDLSQSTALVEDLDRLMWVRPEGGRAVAKCMCNQ